MEELLLVIPSREHEAMAREYQAEFREYRSVLHGVSGLDKADDYGQWLNMLADMRDAGRVPDGYVSADTYFLIRKADNRLLGMINIRHRLNEYLLREGGHIGYSIRPTERRKGYASAMLRMALDRCRELGIDRVLVTCDKNNIASAGTIRKNGGVLENEVVIADSAEVLQRYWIRLELP